MASTENMYQGGYSSLNPDNGNFTGFRMSGKQLSKMGFPGHPSKADQVSELASAARAGAKTFEVTFLGMQGETDQVVPKQQLNEIRALAKLTGIKPTFHGPLVDAAGFSSQGWGGESARVESELRITEALRKAHAIKPEGGIPVVFHTANGVPGITYRPGNTKKGEERFVRKTAPVVDVETGKVIAEAKEEIRHRVFGREGLATPKKESVQEYIQQLNATEWDNKLEEIEKIRDQSYNTLKKSGVNPQLCDKFLASRNEKEMKETLKELQESLQQRPPDYRMVEQTHRLEGDLRKKMAGLMEKAYKSAERKKDLRQQAMLNGLAESWKEGQMTLQKNTGPLAGVFLPLLSASIVNGFREVTEKEGHTPELYQASEDFAKEKTIKTFANAAYNSYDEFKKNMPTLAIENVWQELAYSTSKDIKDIMEGIRGEFAKKLIKEKHMDKKEAKKLAKEKIGMTFDMGHLNIMKKHGFNNKDIIEETKKMAPYVKHLHVTDNFGFNDSHLAPGMGNVPIKEIMEELEKAGRLDEIHKIVEAGGIMQHFQQTPHHPFNIAAFGSPVYGMKKEMAWNQLKGITGSYFSGYGTVNPEGHHGLYGAGFTMLPPELGGNMPGAGGNGRQGSYMGGTPFA